MKMNAGSRAKGGGGISSAGTLRPQFNGTGEGRIVFKEIKTLKGTLVGKGNFPIPQERPS